MIWSFCVFHLYPPPCLSHERSHVHVNLHSKITAKCVWNLIESFNILLHIMQRWPRQRMHRQSVPVDDEVWLIKLFLSMHCSLELFSQQNLSKSVPLILPDARVSDDDLMSQETALPTNQVVLLTDDIPLILMDCPQDGGFSFLWATREHLICETVFIVLTGRIRVKGHWMLTQICTFTTEKRSHTAMTRCP